MAELKTKKNEASVMDFLHSLAANKRTEDCLILLEMMKKITKEEPKMWGSSIVGFGNYRYESPRTGRSGEWFITGFSPRKQNMTVYIMPGFAAYGDLLKKLGKYKTGVGCLYFNKLTDIDSKVLKELVSSSFKYIKEKYSKK